VGAGNRPFVIDRSEILFSVRCREEYELAARFEEVRPVKAIRAGKVDGRQQGIQKIGLESRCGVGVHAGGIKLEGSCERFV
jgi:hypothetical protein